MVELCTVCCWAFYLSNFGCYWWQTGKAYSLQFSIRWTVWPWLWCSVNRFV